MSMLLQLEERLKNEGLFNGEIPKLLHYITLSMPSNTIPYRVKLAIAVSELILFTSQFRVNMKLWDDAIIPINSITFCLAKSGASKDSSVKAARQCFKRSYDYLNEQRAEQAKQVAINKAMEKNLENPTMFQTYKEFFVTPPPLFVAPSTTEGFIQHLNDLENVRFGAGFIFSGEIGAELSSNPVLVDNIKTLSELYDAGNKEIKMLKNRENTLKEVKNMPTSALFLGSQDNIIFDEAIKRKFKQEFNTKLARRSFLVYADQDIDSKEYASVDEMLDDKIKQEEISLNYRREVDDFVYETAQFLCKNVAKTMFISEEVRRLYTLYLTYNYEQGLQIQLQYPMTKLTRTHMQWKALKLAAALALVEGRYMVEREDFIGAVTFVESISNDIFNFEKDLNKEPYELFVKYCNDNETKEQIYSMHTLKKLGYIGGTNSLAKLKELSQLASSCDSNGIYTLKDTDIVYKRYETDNEISVSYVSCTGDKATRATKVSKGYEVVKCKFEELLELLELDVAYSPFIFKNGIRSNENIVSDTNWIVFDIDKSNITDVECNLMLSDINHITIRTSDATNPYKFRLLVELNIKVDVSSILWKKFTKLIADDLSIIIDELPKGQIFYNYSTSKDTILYVLDEKPLDVKPYLIKLNNDKYEPKPISSSEASKLLEDPHTTFNKAFEAKDGEGSRKMIWAIRYAKELGATKEYAYNLVKTINDYWVVPLPEKRLQQTILNQIERIFNE